MKPGLWEARSSVLDADGRETAPPEQAALSRLPPEALARMAEAMKARGVSMPDAKARASTRSASTWRWHSSCPTLNSESDGEAVFDSAESYRARLTTTAAVRGRTTTTTRMVQAKRLGAACGDVKPLAPNSLGR